ncbi:MAG: HAMP domain-containing histidine kinase [Propionibacteriaceae bacterium]|jgi:two-component system OmpR family sensor kinase|nr:HAMP domain-containing histidine kinase [Propionibacteriaceae bacterium]
MVRKLKLQPLTKHSLVRRLVGQTTLIVAVVTVVLSALSLVASFQILLRELDDRLLVSAQRVNIAQSFPTDADPCDRYASDLIRLEVINNRDIFVYTCPSLPNENSLRQLAAITPAAGPQTIVLSDMGVYRALAIQLRYSDRIVVALPYAEVSKPMTGQVGAMGILTLIAIGAAYLGTRLMVTKSLASLDRLTQTATYVSNLPLDSGDGIVGVRFNDPDASPESEVGCVGQAFNHMLDNVEGALAARHASETKVRQFVADASHELRNPLASIRGYAELTRRNGEDLPPDTAYALTRIESEGERMTALVNDLLLLARLDASPELDHKPTDITDIVLNAVSDAQAAGPDHEWKLDIPETLIIIPGDSDQLHQVLANLLANARIHTPARTKVTTSLRVEGGWAVLSVGDNGPGVPEDAQETIFERFSRVDSSRMRQAGGQSTGLGLAIVSATVAAHGGTVELNSVPGNTVFTVRLPMANPKK